MIGPEARKVRAVMQTAMLAGSQSRDLHEAILTHPTIAEGLGVLFSWVPPQPRG
jgi:pyruvate/2-oxoglutarate dehydrogenase complex dihydrolipoamide dehydrogenase (E3) component